MNFKIDDLVMVYFPVAQRSLSQKLLPKYEGPFRIINKLDSVTFRVQSVENKRRIFVVHVQRMLKYNGEIKSP